MKLKKDKYEELLNHIGLTLQSARQNAVKVINSELVKANWEIGVMKMKTVCGMSLCKRQKVCSPIKIVDCLFCRVFG